MKPRLIPALTALLAATTGVFVLAEPAFARPGPHGYVWAYQPATASYDATSGYEYNSAGGAVQIVRSGPGDYRVRFVGLATPSAIAHASAYGVGNARFCTLAGWAASGADELLRVRCFDGTGAAADSRFVASVTGTSPGGFAYAYSQVAVPVGWQSPPLQYDSTGADVQVQRTGVGRYLVDLGALAADSPGTYLDGYLEATAVGSAPVRCEVQDPSFWPAGHMPVTCYDIDGAWVDSRFTVSYSRTTNLLGVAPAYGDAMVMPSPVLPPSVSGWTSGGGAPTAIELGEGSYLVTFPGLAHPHGHAVATVFGTPPAYCNVAAWWPSGTDQLVWVQCYDGGAHEPTAVYAFNVTFTP